MEANVLDKTIKIDNNILKKAQEYVNENKSKIKIDEKFLFHLTGEIGWINDPNGFSYFKNQIHLFYQHNPFDIKWGPMYWGHAVSNDFIKWEFQDLALAPDKFYDYQSGAFSGSAIEHDGKMYLLYTGSLEGYQTQCIASSSDGKSFVKDDNNPIIDESQLPNGCRIADFRDPKVWKKDNTYYLIVSAKNKDNDFSKLLLYSSQDLYKWQYLGVMLENSQKTEDILGKMFECPDYFSLDDNDVIIVSPQTTKNHRNGDNNVAIIGKLNYNNANFNITKVQELDKGFDFYAPQTMQMPDGRRILVAWMASWNRVPITAFYGLKFAGAMTLPRELQYKNGHMYQQPIRELDNYLSNIIDKELELIQNKYVKVLENQPTAFEINLEFSKDDNIDILLFADKNNKGLTISYLDGIIQVDRSAVTVGYYEDSKIYKITDVKTNKESKTVKIRAIVDRYSCEIFIDDGYSVITSTLFANKEQCNVVVKAEKNTTVKIVLNEIKI